MSAQWVLALLPWAVFAAIIYQYRSVIFVRPPKEQVSANLAEIWSRVPLSLDFDKLTDPTGITEMLAELNYAYDKIVVGKAVVSFRYEHAGQSHISVSVYVNNLACANVWYAPGECNYANRPDFFDLPRLERMTLTATEINPVCSPHIEDKDVWEAIEPSLRAKHAEVRKEMEDIRERETKRKAEVLKALAG